MSLSKFLSVGVNRSCFIYEGDEPENVAEETPEERTARRQREWSRDYPFQRPERHPDYDEDRKKFNYIESSYRPSHPQEQECYSWSPAHVHYKIRPLLYLIMTIFT